MNMQFSSYLTSSGMRNSQIYKFKTKGHKISQDKKPKTNKNKLQIP